MTGTIATTSAMIAPPTQPARCAMNAASSRRPQVDHRFGPAPTIEKNGVDYAASSSTPEKGNAYASCAVVFKCAGWRGDAADCRDRSRAGPDRVPGGAGAAGEPAGAEELSADDAAAEPEAVGGAESCRIVAGVPVSEHQHGRSRGRAARQGEGHRVPAVGAAADAVGSPAD